MSRPNVKYTSYKGLVLSICVLLATMSASLAADYDKSASELPEYSTAYDPARNPFDDGSDALELARKTNRFVLIMVGGDWCSWCHALDRLIHDDRNVYNTLHGNYVVLKVNMSRENDNREFLAGLPKTNGYPHLFITLDDGTVIHSTDTTHLVKSGKYVQEHVVYFLDRWANERPTR